VGRRSSSGPNARLQLVAESRQPLCVEVPLQRYCAQDTTPGSYLNVPPRDVNVFAGS